MADLRKAGPPSERVPLEARFPWMAVILAAVVGVLLRAVAARGDLWLDEIWTLDLVRGISSPWDLVTRLKHDNNHPLNSLLCWFLLESRHDIVFRLPAVFAGGLAVVAGARVAWQLADEPGRRLAALAAAACCAVSFLMVNYGSEARGYGLALACGLIAWVGALEGRVSRPALWIAVYWLAALLALLAHASSIYLLLGLVGASACEVVMRWSARRAAIRELVVWHGVPLIACGIYTLAFLRGITIGGGTPSGVAPFAAQLGASLTGIPEAAGGAVHAAVLATLVGWVLVREARRSAVRFVMFAASMLIAPLLVQVLTGNRLLYPRYFLIPAAVLMIGVVVHLAESSRTSRARGAVLGLALVCVAGHAWTCVELARFGRGSYREAIAWMAEVSPFKVVVVASDHDFRTGTVLAYYSRQLGLGERVQVIRRDSVAAVRPEWIILHRPHPAEEPAATFAVAEGIDYRLERSWRGGRLSGFSWYVYRYAGATASRRGP